MRSVPALGFSQLSAERNFAGPRAPSATLGCYAESLQVPFVFSSNGDGFDLHDRTGASAEREVNLALHEFPSPQELWQKYRTWKKLTAHEETIVLQDYHDDGSGNAPRYYQVNAVTAAIEAIAKSQDRILVSASFGTASRRPAALRDHNPEPDRLATAG
jgi:type I site-specific restriction endonuclease